jgi:hypothetical protein
VTNSDTISIQSAAQMDEASLDRLLLDILSKPLSDTEETVSQFSRDDWKPLFERARLHGAGVLLANKLIHVVSIDETARETISSVYINAVANDARLAKQTAKVVSQFTDKHIPVLALKGPALSRALGYDSSSKMSADIDLLVQPADVEVADAELRSFGYSPSASDPNERCYTNLGLPSIDLHWSLIRWHDGELNSMDNCIAVEIECVQIPVLEPTVCLLYLALHAGYHHLCTDWASIHDIAQCTLRWKDSIDWQRFGMIANQSGTSSSVYSPIRLAVQHFGSSVPDDVLCALKPPIHLKTLDLISQSGFDGKLANEKDFIKASRKRYFLSQPDVFCQLSLVARWLKHKVRATRFDKDRKSEA